jgi:hypothetical protein
VTPAFVVSSARGDFAAPTLTAAQARAVAFVIEHHIPVVVRKGKRAILGVWWTATPGAWAGVTRTTFDREHIAELEVEIAGTSGEAMDALAKANFRSNAGRKAAARQREEIARRGIRRARDHSLWTAPSPSRKPEIVAIRSRYATYPHFTKMLDEYVDLVVPDSVTVRWARLAPLVQQIPVHSAEEAHREREFIADVARRMKQGDDLPPLLLRHGAIHDGRHRALAGQQNGIGWAPVVDTDAFWSEPQPRKPRKPGEGPVSPAYEAYMASLGDDGVPGGPRSSNPHDVGSSHREKMADGSVETRTLLERDCVPERGETVGASRCYERWEDDQGNEWVERQRNPTEISPGVMLTDKQAEALQQIREAMALHQRPRSLWDYGSTTISRLRSLGLITTRNGWAYPTEA